MPRTLLAYVGTLAILLTVAYLVARHLLARHRPPGPPPVARRH